MAWLRQAWWGGHYFDLPARCLFCSGLSAPPAKLLCSERASSREAAPQQDVQHTTSYWWYEGCCSPSSTGVPLLPGWRQHVLPIQLCGRHRVGGLGKLCSWGHSPLGTLCPAAHPSTLCLAPGRCTCPAALLTDFLALFCTSLVRLNKACWEVPCLLPAHPPPQGPLRRQDQEAGHRASVRPSVRLGCLDGDGRQWLGVFVEFKCGD